MNKRSSGHILVAFSFLATGMGAHLTQTAGLALAADRATDQTRPQVVALLYVMFLLGMGLAAVAFGLLLADFTKFKLIQKKKFIQILLRSYQSPLYLIEITKF